MTQMWLIKNKASSNTLNIMQPQKYPTVENTNNKVPLLKNFQIFIINTGLDYDNNQ